MNYYVYFLYSKKIDKFYVGYTGDVLNERLRKHNTNHKGYTGKTNDWKIVYTEQYETKTIAYARERAIKKRKSRVYLEQLIKKSQ